MISDSVYIGGGWRLAEDPDRHQVTEAATGSTLYSVPESTTAEVNEAVAAAQEAAPSWSATPPEDRAELLLALRAGAEARVDEIAHTWAREAGMPITAGKSATAGLPLSVLESLARHVVEFDFNPELGNSRIVHEPRGVAVGITPWNYPFSQVVIKAATAIAAGCTVVAKPSELAPGCALIFTEIVDEAGFPPGVFNLLPGSGEGVGAPLVSHTGTDVVSFTGSTATGVEILRMAATLLKPCTLELGGKSPMVFLPGAPLPEAVASGLSSCFRNNGQTCTALTRFIVPRSDMDAVTAIAVEHAENAVVGDPLDEATTIGPLVSAGQLARVQDFIRSGFEDGAELATGGLGPPAGLESGYFVKPSVFTNVDNGSRIAQEEIFGPVLSIIPYDGVEDAIRLGNDSAYGLAAAVWGPDTGEAASVAERLVAGTISINGGAFNPEAPYGGLRRSGLGHELGEAGLREFLRVKVLNR